MGARHKARKRALDILFEADVRGADPLETLALARDRRVAEGEGDLPEYAVELVQGVTAHRERIDEVLSTYSLGWTLDRMPAVDRNLLRLGTFELLWGDVPPAVAIDEAVELTRELSTDDSPSFVNGLLARIEGERATLDLGA
ncbi:MAG: transcription antitermination factor NusB [Candidatus Nanopelagicales bacterium]